MTENLWKKLSEAILVALYPLVIFLGLKFFDPRWVSLMMVAVVGIRLLGRPKQPRTGLSLAVALMFAAGLTLLTGSEFGLLFYPVVVNGVMFTLFFNSLLHPPNIIETFARLQDPELPAAVVAYTRKVTLAWTIFFVLNGSLAALTTTLSHEYWTLYNGLIAYLLMGTLFVGEWLIRQRVKGRHRA